MISFRSSLPLALYAVITSVFADSSFESKDAPLVTLDYGTFQGFKSTGNTESFLGVPFAQPPVGELRFNNPIPPKPFSGVWNATQFGSMCSQQVTVRPSFPNLPGLNGGLPYLATLIPQPTISYASEDCLYLNVVRPEGISEGAHLPVIVWIPGGAFEVGDSSGYDGANPVSRSLSLKLPVLYVSFNYRLNVFGFLGGKEIKTAGLGNFGLYDQRFALEWVQKYIYYFGGDPNRVILWGQSAGSISVMLQMVAYDGNLGGLFHGAFMESGSAIPIHDITHPKAQANYDFLLEQTNCSTAENTLDCLRHAPYEAIRNATQKTPFVFSYTATNLAWSPSVDGILLKQTMRKSLAEGKYSKIPAILGNVDDEGTLFSLFNLNVTTNHQFLKYIRTNFLVGINREEIEKVEKAYPENPILGSPYDVGKNDILSPQYKRISSFQGDFVFQLPRRYALRYLSGTQNVWSYLWKRNKRVPALGSFHASDLQEFYNITGHSDCAGTDALINFAYTLNPNVSPGGYPSGAAPSVLANISWPQYYLDAPKLLTFEDPDVLTFTDDTFRAEAMQVLDEIQDRMGL